MPLSDCPNFCWLRRILGLSTSIVLGLSSTDFGNVGNYSSLTWNFRFSNICWVISEFSVRILLAVFDISSRVRRGGLLLLLGVETSSSSGSLLGPASSYSCLGAGLDVVVGFIGVGVWPYVPVFHPWQHWQLLRVDGDIWDLVQRDQSIHLQTLE